MQTSLLTARDCYVSIASICISRIRESKRQIEQDFSLLTERDTTRVANLCDEFGCEGYHAINEWDNVTRMCHISRSIGSLQDKKQHNRRREEKSDQR